MRSTIARPSTGRKHGSSVQRLIGGLAALALGLSLAACGSEDAGATDEPGDTGSSASSSDASTGESTGTEEPAQIDEGGEVAPDQFAQMIKDGIEKTTSAHVVFSTSGGAGGLEGEGDVDYSAQPPDMQLTMKVSSQEMHMLLVDGIMYIESPQAQGKFMKYDLTDPNNPLGSQFVDQLDPAAAMSQFSQALSSVTSLGEEEVDGQTLAHYVMTIDTSKLAAESKSAGLPDQLKADVWLDDESRMAKSSIELGQGATYDTTLSDFDEPVDIQAPDPSKIVEMPQG